MGLISSLNFFNKTPDLNRTNFDKAEHDIKKLHNKAVTGEKITGKSLKKALKHIRNAVDEHLKSGTNKNQAGDLSVKIIEIRTFCSSVKNGDKKTALIDAIADNITLLTPFPASKITPSGSTKLDSHSHRTSTEMPSEPVPHTNGITKPLTDTIKFQGHDFPRSMFSKGGEFSQINLLQAQGIQRDFALKSLDIQKEDKLAAQKNVQQVEMEHADVNTENSDLLAEDIASLKEQTENIPVKQRKQLQAVAKQAVKHTSPVYRDSDIKVACLSSDNARNNEGFY